jgi:formiminoglutamase
MSDISIFFQGLSSRLLPGMSEGCIGKRSAMHIEGGSFPEIVEGSVVVIGCPECRRSSSVISATDLFVIRKEFYGLQDHFPDTRVIDLGDILPGDSVEDTYFALTSAIFEVVRSNAVALILGGGHDLTYANYLAYQKLERIVNLACVDARFDMGSVEDELSAERFLQKIVLHQPNILFNFSNLGYQTYYVGRHDLETMRKMFFDTYRVGEIQSRLDEAEPIIRTADIVSFDLKSIRASDLPASHLHEPNGFFGQEACAISRYAGLSDKLTSFGLYELTPHLDSDGRSTKLVAQMLWYFVWGVANRKKDYPFSERDDHMKYTVTIQNGQYDIIFYKSPRSDRWWMEVPYPSVKGERYERHFMVPCGYSDYLQACKDEMPDRWWQTYQKLG